MLSLLRQVSGGNVHGLPTADIDLDQFTGKVL